MDILSTEPALQFYSGNFLASVRNASRRWKHREMPYEVPAIVAPYRPMTLLDHA